MDVYSLDCLISRSKKWAKLLIHDRFSTLQQWSSDSVPLVQVSMISAFSPWKQRCVVALWAHVLST